MTTKHTCRDGRGPAFGYRTAGCPRCEELTLGAKPVQWGPGRARIEQERCAWPGGYPRFFATSDGDALSYAAARAEQEQIKDAIADKLNNGWRVVGCDVNWEDAQLVCAHTNERIESAYADD